jgi:DNA-binding MarR family transcriptional regulator
MSSPQFPPDFVPFIALADKCARALRNDMLEHGHRQGFTEIASSHNAVFATLPSEGARAADMALRSGVTRQSMGEVIRDMARLGVLETIPDPADGRAKIVRFTDYGTKLAQVGKQHIMDLEGTFRAEFGDEDWETTRRVLRRVTEMLEPDGPIEPTPASIQFSG